MNPVDVSGGAPLGALDTSRCDGERRRGCALVVTLDEAAATLRDGECSKVELDGAGRMAANDRDGCG